MRSFFAKAGESDAPNRIVMPETDADWEGGDLVVKAPRRLMNSPKSGLKTEPVQNPESGDQVFVYMHLNDHGGGLTGVATIGKVRQEESSNLKIQLTAVSLFQSPYLHFFGPKDARKFSRGGRTIEATGFLREFHRYRPNRTLEMSEANVHELAEVLRQLGDLSIAVSKESGRVITRSDPLDRAR